MTGIALNTAFRAIGLELGLLTIIVGHATFCIVVIYNNVDRPAAADVALDRGGLGRPGRRHVHDLPSGHHPGHPDGADRRGAARLRAVVRRDHRHQLHVRGGHPDAAALDLQQLPAAEPAAAGQRGGRPRAAAVDHPGLSRFAADSRPGGRGRRADLSRTVGADGSPLVAERDDRDEAWVPRRRKRAMRRRTGHLRRHDAGARMTARPRRGVPGP